MASAAPFLQPILLLNILKKVLELKFRLLRDFFLRYPLREDSVSSPFFLPVKRHLLPLQVQLEQLIPLRRPSLRHSVLVGPGIPSGAVLSGRGGQLAVQDRFYLLKCECDGGRFLFGKPLLQRQERPVRAEGAGDLIPCLRAEGGDDLLGSIRQFPMGVHANVTKNFLH